MCDLHRGGDPGWNQPTPQRQPDKSNQRTSHLLLLAPRLSTTSFLSFSLFVKNHWFAWRVNQWPLVRETLSSFVPPSNYPCPWSNPNSLDKLICNFTQLPGTPGPRTLTRNGFTWLSWPMAPASRSKSTSVKTLTRNAPMRRIKHQGQQSANKSTKHRSCWPSVRMGEWQELATIICRSLWMRSSTHFYFASHP